MRAVRYWVYGFVAVLVGFATPSNAADISAIPGTNGAPTLIIVRGELAGGDEKTFVNLALAHSAAVVVLNSNGGLLLTGLEIGKAIRLKGFMTIVPEGFQCASACALAWLAGTPRLLSPKGRVGFHAAYLEADGRLMPTSTGNALVGAYLAHLNLPTSAVIYITSAPPDGMNWLNLDDAQRTGIDAKRFDQGSSGDSSATSPAAAAAPLPSVQRETSAAPSQTTPVITPNVRAIRSPPGTFAGYPTSAGYTGGRATPQLNTPAKYAYRTRLRVASGGAPNFSGRHVVAEWGCGTSCMTGAVVDLETGEVAFFPGSVSGWGMVDPDFRAAEYRLGSSLIVLSGQMNEKRPIGSHYFHFSDSKFRYLGTVLTSDDFKSQLGTRWLSELAERPAANVQP